MPRLDRRSRLSPFVLTLLFLNIPAFVDCKESAASGEALTRTGLHGGLRFHDGAPFFDSFAIIRCSLRDYSSQEGA